MNPLYYVTLTLLTWLQIVTSLICNKCHNADRPADCKRTGQQCLPGQICFTDANEITYDEGSKRERTVFMYKMGCAHASICKDGVSYGPGPYGYSRIVRSCCCTDKCIHRDGAGKGEYDHCAFASVNVTMANGDKSKQTYALWTLSLSSILSIMSISW